MLWNGSLGHIQLCERWPATIGLSETSTHGKVQSLLYPVIWLISSESSSFAFLTDKSYTIAGIVFD